MVQSQEVATIPALSREPKTCYFPAPDMRKTTRTAILLAAYGSRHPRARSSFEHIERRVADLYPDAAVRWCFTSKNVRKLHAADSPAEALARLASEGFEAVCVQSLHIIPGAEYEEMLAAAREAQGSFTRLATGAPLLHDPEDTARVARALLSLLPAGDYGTGIETPAIKASGARPAHARGQRCAVFLGHGTAHPGHARYAELARELARLDERAFLGTLEQGPDAASVCAALIEAGCTETYLVPFFFAAGVHVENDMLGDGPESWVSVLRRAGIEATPIVQGVGEQDRLVDIWLDHLAEAMARLKA